MTSAQDCQLGKLGKFPVFSLIAKIPLEGILREYRNIQMGTLSVEDFVKIVRDKVINEGSTVPIRKEIAGFFLPVEKDPTKSHEKIMPVLCSAMQFAFDESRCMRFSVFDIQQVLNTRLDVEESCADPLLRCREDIDWVSISKEINVIAHHMKQTNCPGIATYKVTAEALQRMPAWTRPIFTEVFSEKFGDLKQLAASVNEENLNYVMNIIKPSISVPLFLEVFTNPEWGGKVAAIIALAELFGVLWKPVDLEHVRMVANAITALIFKVTTITSSVKEFVSTKMAKVFGPEGESFVKEMEPQVGETDTLQQCSLCCDNREVNRACWECELPFCEGCWASVYTTNEDMIAQCKAGFHRDRRGEFTADDEFDENLDLEAPQKRSAMLDMLDRIRAAPDPIQFIETVAREKGLSTTRMKNIIEKAAIREAVPVEATIFERIYQFIRGLGVNILAYIKKDSGLFSLIGLFTCVSNLVCGFWTTVFATKKEGSSFIDRILNFQKSFSYISRGQKAVQEVFSEGMNIISSMLCIDRDSSVTQFKQKLLTTMELIQKISLELAVNPGNFVNNTDEYNRIDTAVKQLGETYKELTHLPDKTNLQILTPIWMNLKKSYDDLVEAWRTYLINNDSRVEPVVCYLWGDTNIGKSTVMDFIINEVNMLEGDYDAKTFTISKGTDYMNGFHNQKGIKIDDRDQIKSNDPAASDSAKIMNAVTTAAWNPSMAALGEKNINVTSAYVYVCSNQPTCSGDVGIVDLEAIERRCGPHFFHVTWPGHQGHGNSFDGCDCLKGRTLNNWSHLRFALQDSNITKANKESGGKLFTMKNGVRVFTEGAIKDIAEFTPREIATSLVAMRLEKIRVFEDAKRERQAVIDAMKAADAQRILEVRAQMAEHEVVPRTPQLINGQYVLVPQSDVVDTTAFKTKPQVILSGPPGIGKTTVMQQLVQCLGASNVEEINTIDEFADFEKRRFQTLKKFVVIHDISTHLNQNYVGYLNFIKERYDTVDANAAIHYIAINRQALSTHLDNDEFLDVIYRRCEVFEFRYKSRMTIRGFKPYGHNDILNIKDPIDYHKFVKIDYFGATKGVTWTPTAVRDFCKNLKPAVSVQMNYTTIPIYAGVVTREEATVTVPISSKEMINLMNNGDKVKAIRTLTSSTIKFAPATTLTKGELVLLMERSIHRSMNVLGVVFEDFDDFLIECMNSSLLQPFIGHYLIMHFTDRTYYFTTQVVDEETTRIVVFRMPNGFSPSKEIDIAIDTFNCSDFSEIVTAHLPSWIFMATQVISTVIKFGLSAGATFHRVAQGLQYRKYYKQNIMQQEHQVVACNYAKDGGYVKTVPNFETSTKADYDPEDVRVFDRYDKYSVSKVFKSDIDGYNRTPSVEFKVKNWVSGNNWCDAFEDEYAHNKKAGPKVLNQNRRIPAKWRSESIKSINKESRVLATQISLKDKPKEAEVEVSHTKIFEQQASTDPAVQDTINIVVRNSGEIIHNDRVAAHIVMLKGHVGLTVGHLFSQVLDENLKVYTSDGVGYKIKLLKVYKNYDVAFFEITDKTCPQFRDITSHFASVKHLIVGRKPAILLTVGRKWSVTPGFPSLTMRSYYVGATSVYEHAGLEVHGHMYVGHQTGFQLPVNTYQGDCGSVLIVCDSQYNKKILGIHAMANDTMAFATQISEELLTDFFAGYSVGQLPPMISQTYVEADVDKWRTDFEVDKPTFIGPNAEFLVSKEVLDGIEIQGHKVYAETSFNNHNPTMTDFWTSPLAMGEKLSEPSILSKWDTRLKEPTEMLENEALKWFQDQPKFSEDDIKLLDRITSDLGDHMVNIVKRRKGKIFKVHSKKSALNRDVNFDHSHKVNTKTSTGYPFSHFKTTAEKGKKAFVHVSKEEIQVIAHNKNGELLHDYINDIIRRARQGKRSLVAFKIFLKDELRKLKKIYEDPVTRSIAGAPLHYVIAMRMYLASFWNSISDCWVDIGPKIGINASGLDWHVMYTKLSQISDIGVDFDYKGWDFSTPWEFQRRVPQIANIMYKALDENWKEEDDTIRIALYEALHEPYIIVGNSVLRAKRGQPSGQPGTAPDNSIINWMMVIFTWCKLLREAGMPELANLASYLENVGTAVYGDDIVLAINPRVIDQFNGLNIPRVLTSMGMTVTPADKMSNFVKYRKVLDLEFLSRRFVKINGIYLGKLDKFSIDKSTQYCRGPKKHYWYKDRDRHITSLIYLEATAQNTLKELAVYGKNEYTKYRDKFHDVLWQRGSELNFPSFDQAMDDIFNSTSAF